MKFHAFIIALVYVTAASGSVSEEYGDHIRRKRTLSIPTTARDDPLLPRHVAPVGYHVWLQPFPLDGYFRGRVDVNISCLVPTKTVILHAAENLNISKAEIFVIEPSTQNKDLCIQSVRSGMAEDWREVKVSDYLRQGSIYQLTLEFVSELRNASCEEAMYFGSYSDDFSEDKWFVATDMKKNKARKVFPCFDELSYKVPYTISIGRPEKMRSLSNMALRASEKMLDQPGWMWDNFETSPPMSTFSVNIFIFDPDVIVPLEPRRELGSTTLHIYAPVDLRDDLQQLGNKILHTVKKLETYFQVKYPLPDLQIVVSPGVWSNLEGFGLSIFSKGGKNYTWPYTFLTDMADQWLVHLVTPRSWSEVPFGNSLAIYASYIGYTEALEDTRDAPSLTWGALYTMMATSNRHRTLIGIGMLRMLNYTLGVDSLSLAFNSFLQFRMYETFVLADVVAAIEGQVQLDSSLPVGVTVPNIVRSWMQTEQFPVITVIRNYQTRTAYVEQHVFTLNDSAESSEMNMDHQWYVPLVLLRGDRLEEKSLEVMLWMKEEKTAHLQTMPPSDIFIMVNPEIIGLFVVNYDPTNWKLIIQHIQTKGSTPRLSATNCAKLLTDAALLAKSGKLSYDVPFELSLMLSDHNDFEPLFAFNKFFLDLHNKLRYTMMKGLLKEYVWKLLSPQYEQYGGYNEKEFFEESTSHGIVMTIMCRLGAEDCTEALAVKYKPGNLHFKGCMVLWSGEDYIWDETLAWAINHNKNNNIDEDVLKNLASCTQHDERIERLMDAILLKYSVRDEDILDVIDMIDNAYPLFNYLSYRWTEIKKIYERKPDLLRSLVGKITSKFVTREGYDLVADFYAARQSDMPSLLPTLRDALQTITKNRKWYDRNLPQIESWLRRYLKKN